jgi:hypothetical protein
MEVAENNPGQEASSITLTARLPDGDLSHNAPAEQGAASEDVNQAPNGQVNLENSDMEIDLQNVFVQELVAPVIVNGDLPVPLFDNF